MNQEQIEVIVSHVLFLDDSHPRQEKPKYFGKIIEMDGSIHLWFGTLKSCLHLAADKATNTIVGGYFDKQETLNGYYHVLYQILIKYGIPYMFCTDNRTVFNYMSLNKDNRTSEKYVEEYIALLREKYKVADFDCFKEEDYLLLLKMLKSSC